ncbi:MAG: tRNA lysidine(34) synthetase TilS [Gammaproteobacteria bacterium]|nr:MAG: tRNA lysidine(34) synthetase TilS [Gammaproteobacteria bacterium]
MPFQRNHLTTLLDRCESVNRLWVAYSGGVDSHVLLHQVHAIREALPEVAGAIHVHHGLQTDADDWAQHCTEICQSLDIPINIIHMDASPIQGKSPEQAARDARYKAFKQLLNVGDVLLLAQHQDDQAETFLLQALRGAGPKGLSAMPTVKRFESAWLVRPMLENSRTQILEYARQHDLSWVEDKSNKDTAIDRNYLRHEILPRLKQRWPAAASTLARSARHSASLSRLTENLIDTELPLLVGSQGNTLSISRLKNLRHDLAATMLRAWIEKSGFPNPAARHIDQILRKQITSDDHTASLVNWPGVEIRRYRDDLHIMHPLQQLPEQSWIHHWQLPEPCTIPELHGTLIAEKATGEGIAEKFCLHGLRVQPRSGGEKCRPAGRAHHQTLKKLFQDKGIPNWIRDRLPLIYYQDKLAAVGDCWICDEFAAKDTEPSYQIRWLIESYR